MTSQQMALTILGMGIITYGIRFSFFIFVDHIKLPEWLLSALRYVPVAVLTAIIVPELLYPGGLLDISLGNERLLAGLVAMIIAWRTHSILWTITVGMIVLWVLQSLNI